MTTTEKRRQEVAEAIEAALEEINFTGNAEDLQTIITCVALTAATDERHMLRIANQLTRLGSFYAKEESRIRIQKSAREIRRAA